MHVLKQLYIQSTESVGNDFSCRLTCSWSGQPYRHHVCIFTPYRSWQTCRRLNRLPLNIVLGVMDTALPDPEILIGIAALGLTVTGFSGLISVLGRRSTGEWSDQEKFQLGQLLENKSRCYVRIVHPNPGQYAPN